MNSNSLENIRLDKRHVVIVVIGGFLLAVIFLLYSHFSTPAAMPLAAPLALGAVKVNGLPAKPTVLKGVAKEDILRDPFALPLELQQSAQVGPMRPQSADSRYVGSGGSMPAGSYGGPARESEPAMPRVSGVVSLGSERMAVLQYGAGSRSYRVHERVGPYEIAAISDDSVTLWGPAGKVVLTMGR